MRLSVVALIWALGAPWLVGVIPEAEAHKASFCEKPLVWQKRNGSEGERAHGLVNAVFKRETIGCADEDIGGHEAAPLLSMARLFYLTWRYGHGLAGFKLLIGENDISAGLLMLHFGPSGGIPSEIIASLSNIEQSLQQEGSGLHGNGHGGRIAVILQFELHRNNQVPGLVLEAFQFGIYRQPRPPLGDEIVANELQLPFASIPKPVGAVFQSKGEPSDESGREGGNDGGGNIEPMPNEPKKDVDNIVRGATFLAAIMIGFAYLIIRLAVRSKREDRGADRRRD
jgi:hypothetical protein